MTTTNVNKLFIVNNDITSATKAVNNPTTGSLDVAPATIGLMDRNGQYARNRTQVPSLSYHSQCRGRLASA
jgi:hypothetical protein